MSRYPQPGTFAAFWSEDHGTGDCVILATSRHKKKATEAEALTMLQGLYGEATTQQIGWWRSITQAQEDSDDLPAELIDAVWGEDGAGSAWVKVAYPVRQRCATCGQFEYDHWDDDPERRHPFVPPTARPETEVER